MNDREQHSDNELLKEEQVCRHLKIGRTTLWQLRRRGELPAVHIGRAVRYRASDVRGFIERNTLVTSELVNSQ